MKKIFTIGYSGFTTDEFIRVLLQNKINVLVDVRSSPYSKYFSEYNKEVLAVNLDKRGIYYRNFAKEFGARQDDTAFYSENGYLDFAKFAKSNQFEKGIEKIEKGIDQNFLFALMCAEKNPVNCHRTIMVARAFSKLGYQIIHLQPEGKSISQDDVDEILLDEYYPLRNQHCLFNDSMAREEMLEYSYAQKNKEIGYKKEED